MSEATFAVLILLVLGWAVVSDLLVRANITSPLVFMVAGYALGNPDWGVLPVEVETPAIHAMTEFTLALLLFSDAARVNAVQLRRDIAVPARLLGIGLPLTLALGVVLAGWLLGDLSWALACFVGATLAPTDAALSAQVVNDEKIPVRIRRALNVESGLNDGIVTPVVGVALAAAASQLGVVGHEDSASRGALLELTIGLAVGLAVGLGSAALITLGARRRWIVTGGRRLATLAAALGSFTLAAALGGNGFIAAFVAGISFGAALKRDVMAVHDAVELPELLGEIMALAVWFLFGAVLVPVVLDHAGPAILAYSVASLTVVRVLPVAVALTRSGLDRSSVLFMGWFGPRGLASIVFALLAVERLGETPTVDLAVSAVALTVMLSVVLHGVSAGPLGRRYAGRAHADLDSPTYIRSRRLVHQEVAPLPPEG